MNYYNCVVECKNTALNTTLADNGIIAGTGPFANSCVVTACEALGEPRTCVGIVSGSLSPIELFAIFIVGMCAISLVGWYFYNKNKEK
jgi:hypothetical protein